MKVESKLKWDGDIIKLRGKKVINKSTFEIGLIIENQAAALCPVSPGGGRLKASISTQSLTEGSKGGADTISKPNRVGVVLVGTPVDYAPHVEFGTVAHTITVKNAKVLSNGKKFFGKTVKHPGTNAQPFLRPAMNLSKGKILTIVKKNSKDIFEDYIK